MKLINPNEIKFVIAPNLDFGGVNAGRGVAYYCPNCGADMRGEQDG